VGFKTILTTPLFEICNLEAFLNQFAIGHYENISSKNRTGPRLKPFAKKTILTTPLFEICNLEAFLNQFAIGHYENISSKNRTAQG
jgi:hypothetical protein